MLRIEKLELAKAILEKDLGSRVMSLVFNDVLVRIRINLQDGIVIIIYFNDHDQYSYNLIFSSRELDRCRVPFSIRAMSGWLNPIPATIS